MGQGTMQYYTNRQLTADELLSAELSRETGGANLTDSSTNGVHHGQSMVLGSSNPGAHDMGRPPSPDHHQQHMLQFPPSQQVGVDPNHDLSYGDQSARRKRSKISRACDECRRKKVRCDASTETGIDTCSNCRRLGVACQFSRVPMKRGPSKGYIKELAERLHTLESQMQPPMVHPDIQYQPMNEVSSPRGYSDFSSAMDTAPIPRKRTYSVFEGLPSSSFTQPPFNARGPHAAFDTGDNTATDPCNPAVTNGSVPKAGNLFWSGEHGLPDTLDVGEVKAVTEEDMTPLGVDDGAFNAYHHKILPIFPVLPYSKERLLELLHQCSREVQEVFLYALYTVTCTNMGRVANAFEKVASYDAAQDLLLSYHARQPVVIRPTAVSLVCLQALLLMILDCDGRGPENLLAKNGAPKHALIQAAIKIGYDLAKILGQLRSKRTSDPDVDSDSNLTRRNWVSLAILARWYALGVADASLVGNYEIGGLEDERVVGIATSQIASYSTFLTEMVTIVSLEPNICQTNTGLGRVVGANLVASLERLAEIERARKFRETPEEATAHNFLDNLEAQLYWTIRLLVKRHLFVYSPYEIIYCAEELINEMHKATPQPRLPSPFDLHSLALASMTLLEATVLPEYASGCWTSLKKVEEILDRRAKHTAEEGEFDNIFGASGWDAKIRAFLEWRQSNSKIQEEADTKNALQPPVMGPNEQRSLQHLADLAVGAEGSVSANASSPPPALSTENMAGASSGFSATSPSAPPPTQAHGRIFVDFTALTKEGYLNVFAGLASRKSR